MSLFGQALSDLYHKQSKGNFFVCTDSGEYPLDISFYLRDKPESFESKMLEYIKGRILDIGCGAGRIMKYLRRRGYDVLGFDIDAGVIKLCKEQGASNVYQESWVNMERFGRFDTLLLLNRSIGIAGKLDGVKALLEKCHVCSNDDALLILDSLEIEPKNATGPEGVFETKLRYKYDDLYGEWFSWIHISSDIMKDALKDTGWFCKKIAKEGDRYCILSAKIP